MRNICAAFLFLSFFVAGPLQAVPLFPAVEKAIPKAQKVGEAEFSFLFWDVYTIALYAPEGVWDAARPYALTARYKLAIDGKDIAARSIDEMRRQGVDEAKLTAWQDKLLAVFPDVAEGTRVTVLTIPNKETRFYKDEKLVGQFKDPAFGPAYLGIWLAENTSEPDVRAALLGQAQ